MKIDQNKAVALTYKLEDVNTQKVLEEATAEHPLEFIFGTDTMFPAFEKELEGLETGSSFEFVLEEDAFGHRIEENITDLPINIFYDESGKLNTDIVKIGETVPMMDAEGNKYQGLILDITDETIKVDFNHPYAGRIMKFSGDILNVREATPKEIEELFAQMHGSCGCSGCGNDQADDHANDGCGGCSGCH